MQPNGSCLERAFVSPSRRRRGSTWFWPALLVLAGLVMAMPAAAEVGIGFGTDLEYNKWYGSRGASAGMDPDGYGASFTMGVRRLTLYDTTGLLAAGVGAGLAKEAARERAQAQANRTGRPEWYTWNQVAPAPGHMTTLSFVWGDAADPSLQGTSQPKSAYSASLFGMWAESAVASWNPTRDLNVGLAFVGGGVMYSIENTKLRGYDGRGHSSLMLGASLPVSFAVLPNTVVSVKPTLDVLGMLFRLAARDDGGPIVAGSLVAQIDVRPIQFIMLSASGRASVVPDFGTREAVQLAAGWNAAVLF